MALDASGEIHKAAQLHFTWMLADATYSMQANYWVGVGMRIAGVAAFEFCIQVI